MIGCMVGTSLAMAPAMVLAPRARFVDLDGPLLLARDREPGLRYEGSIVYHGPDHDELQGGHVPCPTPRPRPKSTPISARTPIAQRYPITESEKPIPRQWMLPNQNEA
jgi:hypothetical protein